MVEGAIFDTYAVHRGTLRWELYVSIDNRATQRTSFEYEEQ